MPKFKLYVQNQPMLLPPDIRDFLPKDHIVFLINEVVDNLNIDSVIKTYSEEGNPAYDPRMMIKVMFYGYTQGIRSSRKIEDALYENIAFRFLSANQNPDHGTINLFRKKHLVDLENVFSQIVVLCGRLDIADLMDISIDGTKIKANASKRNLFTQEQIDKVKSKVKEMLDDAQRIDDEEDKKFGSSRGYNQIPEDLKDPETRKKKIKEAQDKLEKLEEAEKEIKFKQEKAKGKEEKEQLNNKSSNTTDPDSSLMKMKDASYKMAYNIQLATSKQIIAAYDIAENASDTYNLPNMIKKSEENTNMKAETVKADSSYFTKEDVQFCKNNSIDAYIPDVMKIKEEKENSIPAYDKRNFKYDSEKDEFICPENYVLKSAGSKSGDTRKYKGTECSNCPCKSQCTKGKVRYLTYDSVLEKLKQEMRTKLNTEEGKKKYLERMSDIEPTIGDLKENRKFNHFLCRGKPMILIETGLASTAHNLVKISNWIKKERKNIKDLKLDALMKLQTAG